MNQRAHVISIEAIRAFRPALVKFAEQVRQALTEVQGDMQRTAGWLEQEQGPYWRKQIRKREEAVAEAKQAVNAKKQYDQADGSKKTAIEEEQALARARRRLEEAHEKVQAVQQWRRELDREWMRQQGLLQRLGRAVEQDVPRSLALLDQLSRSLEAYAALAAPRAHRDAEAEAEAEGRGVMARGRGDDAPIDSEESAADARKPNASRDDRENEG